MTDNTYDDNNGLYDEVVLKDEEGRDVRFDHVLTFAYEGEYYIALLPLDKIEGVEDDEVVLLRIVKENGEDTYVSIDNEVLLDEVFAEFLDLMDEINEEEDKNGENE